MRARAKNSLALSFVAGRTYDCHVHVDCIHAVDEAGHHFRLLDETTDGRWLFDNFEFVSEEEPDGYV